MENTVRAPISEKNPGPAKTLRSAAWLGWKIESNWTDPFIFAFYSIVRPITQAAILIVMYLVIRGGNFADPDFVNMYIGNAFYLLVNGAMQGVYFGILDDREHYRTLKYIYIAPLQVPIYLVGRGLASIVVASISVVITLLFGVVFLKVPIVLAEVNWLLLLVALALGMITMVSLGVILGGWALMIKNNIYTLGDALAAGLFIFSGAVFPLTVLPRALRVVGYALPLAYWFVLIRRALVPEIGHLDPMFSHFSDGNLLLIAVAFALLFAVLAVVTFRFFDHQAREKGNIDMVSNY